MATFFPSTSYTSGWRQADEDQAADIDARFAQYRYRWADSTARGAQTGMRVDDHGYQIDTGVTYRYNGSEWVTESPGSQRIIPSAATNGSVSSTGIVTSTAQSLVRIRDAFPSGYQVFRVTFDVTTSAAAGVNLLFAANATDAVTAYDYEYQRAFSTTVDAAQSLNQTAGALSPIGLLAGRHIGSVLITSPNLAAATIYDASSTATLNPMTTSSGKLAVAGQHRTATAYNSLTILGSSGNVTVNRLTIEGVS